MKVPALAPVAVLLMVMVPPGPGVLLVIVVPAGISVPRMFWPRIRLEVSGTPVIMLLLPVEPVTT